MLVYVIYLICKLSLVMSTPFCVFKYIYLYLQKAVKKKKLSKAKEYVSLCFSHGLSRKFYELTYVKNLALSLNVLQKYY